MKTFSVFIVSSSSDYPSVTGLLVASRQPSAPATTHPPAPANAPSSHHWLVRNRSAQRSVPLQPDSPSAAAPPPPAPRAPRRSASSRPTLARLTVRSSRTE